MIVLFAIGCGSPSRDPQVPASPIESPRVVVKEALAREVALPTKRVAVQVGSFHANVRASGEPALQTSKSGSQAVAIPIGTRMPVVCVLSETPVDLALVMDRMVTPLIDDGMKLYQSEVAVEPYARGSRFFIRVPYGSKKGIGELKLGVTSGPEGGLLCAHDELGYDKAFRGIVADMTSSLERPHLSLTFIDVERMTANGRVLGMFETRIFSDGKRRFEHQQVLSAAVGKDRFVSHAYATLTTTTNDGKVLEHNAVSSENGQSVLGMNIVKENDIFRFDGEHKKNRREGTFSADIDLKTPLLLAPKIRGLGPGKELRWLQINDETGQPEETGVIRGSTATKSGKSKHAPGAAATEDKKRFAVRIDTTGLILPLDKNLRFERLYLRGLPH